MSFVSRSLHAPLKTVFLGVDRDKLGRIGFFGSSGGTSGFGLQIGTVPMRSGRLASMWIVLMLSPGPSCAMYKDNAVSNVVAEMGRDLVSTTARLSDLSMPLKGEVRRSPEPSARQPIARSGKFVRRAYSRRALDCAYAFSHRARCTKTTLFETW